MLSEQTVALVETPQFLCSEDMKTFYVSFKDGHIKVGQMGNLEPFLEHTLSEPFPVSILKRFNVALNAIHLN